MPRRDTIALLRELDPMEAHPRRRACGRRNAPRVVALAVATAAAVVLGLVLTTDQRRAPGIAEAAYATLTAHDAIVHLRLRSEYHFPQDQPATTELWTRSGGRQLRVVYDGGEHEFVRDTDARHAASYVRHRNEVTVFSEPEMWQVGPSEDLSFAGPEGARRLADELPALLARARDGDPAVRRLPDAQLDGIAAARLEARATIRAGERAQAGSGAPGLQPVAIRTIVWLDLDSHLPRRIERFFGGRRATTTDVVLAERLAVGDATERLLEMPRHPGATHVAGGPA